MKFRVEHTVRNISLTDFETLFFDEAFNTALCQELKLDRTLIERKEQNGTLVRVVKVGPQREIPGPVAKVLGATKIEYTEHLTYPLGSYRGTYKTVASIMADKVDSSGGFSFRAAGKDVVRVAEGDVKVKIFGLGTVVERFIVSDVEESYDRAAAFTQSWLARSS